MKQYKILTTKNKLFGNKFDPQKVEDVINSFAKDGWIVISITSADYGAKTFGAQMQELIIVMEKDA